MTMTSTAYRKAYTGDNSVTTFPYDFYILASTHLAVYLDNVLQTSGYSVTGAGTPSGGNVVFTTAPGASVDITLLRQVPQTQEVDYQEGGAFPANTHEQALDKLTMLVTQLQEQLDRRYVLPTEETGTAAKIAVPSLTSRLSKYFGWDSSGNPAALAAPTATSLTTVLAASLLDDATAAALLATLLGSDAVLSPAQITADTNDYNPTGLASAVILRISTDANNRVLTGIAGGAAGRLLVLLNIGSHAITVRNDDAGSTAANRIICSVDGRVVLAPNQAAMLWYDSISSRWRLVQFGLSYLNHGDLIGMGISGGPKRLAVGANGKVLVADSTEATGFGWASRAQQGWKSWGQNSRNNATTPNTQYDLAGSAVQLWEPASGHTYLETSISTATVNISTAGPAVNGRDQAGAFSSNSWLYFYWIYNPGTDTLAGTVSLSAPFTGPTMPSGYTAWAYAGAVRLDGSSNLVKTRMHGNWRYYETEQNALTNGTATAETAVSVASFVPPTASAFMLGGPVTQQSGQEVVRLRAITGLDARTVFSFAASGETNQSGWGNVILPNVSQQFYYLWGSAAVARAFTAYVYAYEEVLSNG
ncbi:tail fiber protein [Caudoviricetes sp.]|nr:tail fiber protein [Caudoviricetes sp.]UOF79643.1 tail fiber protein [Caudoviricetes sp.]UOF79833.1 tail fiber protein [Bacteriophage sp.]UOF81314.1 tail fiber protein [Caudoviricetes sp.]